MKQPQSRCLITRAVVGPCRKCGKYQRDGMHICDDLPVCADCCTEHRVDHEWSEVAPVSGEQMDLQVLLEDHD